MKKHTLREEDKVRIIFSSDIGMNTEETGIKKKILRTTKLCLKDVDYLTRRNQLVLYADMSFDKAIADGLIKEIIIGPKVNMTVDEVTTYLWVRGYENVCVKKSDITYI